MPEALPGALLGLKSGLVVVHVGDLWPLRPSLGALRAGPKVSQGGPAAVPAEAGKLLTEHHRCPGPEDLAGVHVGGDLQPVGQGLPREEVHRAALVRGW